MKRLLTSLLCATALCAGYSSTASAMDPKELDAAIEKYILANPQVIMKSLRSYQNRDTITAEQQEKLQKSEGSPVLGNPNGDVTMVVFFDYHCGFCKRFYPVIASLLEEDKELKIVFKELPILSEDSELAARAALAVYFIDKEKYFPFHTALMKATGSFDMAKLTSIAKQAGISDNQLSDGIKSDKVSAEIARTKTLAEEIDVTGTPVVFIGKQMIPGATSLDVIRSKISAEREANGKKG